MTRLTKEDIQQLDQKIDDAVGRERLLLLPRDIALMNLLRYFEDYCRLFALRRRNFADGAALMKAGQDAMQFAIKWIHEYCPLPTRHYGFELDFDAYEASMKLHEAAMRYSTVCDLMAQLHRGAILGERGKDNIIYLAYEDLDAEVFDTCSHFMASPDPPNFQQDLGPALDLLNPQELLEDVKIHRHHSGRIKYSLPDSVYAKVATAQRKILAPRWELGADWEVGGYTLRDFREFWVALLSITWIHNAVCFFSGTKGGALESVVKALSSHGWVTEIARRSGLDGTTVSAIVSDLTYEASMYQAGKKQPDVTSQPFFCLRGEFLALSNQLVLLSNAERNLWDLVSIRRPEIHSRLRNEKEHLWLRELAPRLTSYGVRHFGPIKISHDNKSSDLDLLVLDDARNFGLGLQLKWLVHPDRIRDAKYADAELLRGLDQAQFALKWLDSKPVRLAEVTGLTTEELKKYRFKSAVLSKNTLGSTSTMRQGLPILTERLLDWILGEPHRRSLETLWRVGEERRYMPKRNLHYADGDVSSEFGGVRFVGRRMGMRKLQDWNPATGIDLTGLDTELEKGAAA